MGERFQSGPYAGVPSTHDRVGKHPVLSGLPEEAQGSLLAHQGHWIHRERLLRWNPRSHQPQHQHCENHTA
jgi:hypothetical protein